MNIQYKIVFENDHIKLGELVSKYSQEGWISQGGVCIKFSTEAFGIDTYYQALI